MLPPDQNPLDLICEGCRADVISCTKEEGMQAKTRKKERDDVIDLTHDDENKNERADGGADEKNPSNNPHLENLDVLPEEVLRSILADDFQFRISDTEKQKQGKSNIHESPLLPSAATRRPEEHQKDEKRTHKKDGNIHWDEEQKDRNPCGLLRVLKIILNFTIQGSRWCDRIGREHKSNSVYFTAHLIGIPRQCLRKEFFVGQEEEASVGSPANRHRHHHHRKNEQKMFGTEKFQKSFTWSGTVEQRCFDPDCRDFRTPIVSDSFCLFPKMIIRLLQLIVLISLSLSPHPSVFEFRGKPWIIPEERFE